MDLPIEPQVAEYYIHAYHRGRYEDAIYALMAHIDKEPQYRDRCIVQELYADAVTRLYILGHYVTRDFEG